MNAGDKFDTAGGISWRYWQNDVECGPFSWEQFQELASDSRISRTNLVNSTGMAPWARIPAGEVYGLFLGDEQPPLREHKQAGEKAAQAPADSLRVRLAISAVLLLAVLWWLWPTGNASSPASGRAVVRMKSPGMLTIWPSTEACSKGASAGSGGELIRLRTETGGFAVEGGTSVDVIGSTFTMRHVRIIDGAYAGFDGWVVREFVRRD